MTNILYVKQQELYCRGLCNSWQGFTVDQGPFIIPTTIFEDIIRD